MKLERNIENGKIVWRLVNGESHPLLTVYMVEFVEAAYQLGKSETEKGQVVAKCGVCKGNGWVLDMYQKQYECPSCKGSEVYQESVHVQAEPLLAEVHAKVMSQRDLDKPMRDAERLSHQPSAQVDGVQLLEQLKSERQAETLKAVGTLLRKECMVTDGNTTFALSASRLHDLILMFEAGKAPEGL